ncbi:MAG: hypothetical protein ATN36_08535 [Epulopiscium sp. Nele67-Bin005]|nr:MAG: hypothetical protein ATN36_08535 [Epulopiscium sp. Nele67-Bin005]
MSTLYEYQNILLSLPDKIKYTKDDLLIKDLLLDKKDNLEIYYAPHNEYINTKSKLLIIGITPGFSQMNTAISTAREGLKNNIDIPTIQKMCKDKARFSGTLRTSLINMLDEIELNNILNIKSCSSLFEQENTFIHTTSLIKHPTFVNKNNYNGHSPKLLGNQFLITYIKNNLSNELTNLDQNIPIIPLGTAVESVLAQLAKENFINPYQILIGFPHPSGANRNRISQLKTNKKNLILTLKHMF